MITEFKWINDNDNTTEVCLSHSFDGCEISIGKMSIYLNNTDMRYMLYALQELRRLEKDKELLFGEIKK